MKLLFFITFIIIILFILNYKIFIKNINKNYNYFIKILKNLNNNVNYLNFGYWYGNEMNLTNANENLINYVYKCFNNKNKCLLDIGCGYGEQDFFLNNKYNINIIALDISNKQITYAKNKCKRLKLKKKIKFIQGDAINIPISDNSFKNMLCLESAFHYQSRCVFFKECFRILKKNSELIIADIVLKKENNSFFSNIFINFFKDILNIPDNNLIDTNTYIHQLTEIGFKVETINITNNTFKHYFDFLNKNLQTNNYIYDLLIKIIYKNINKNPFEYIIFKCYKP